MEKDYLKDIKKCKNTKELVGKYPYLEDYDMFISTRQLSNIRQRKEECIGSDVCYFIGCAVSKNDLYEQKELPPKEKTKKNKKNYVLENDFETHKLLLKYSYKLKFTDKIYLEIKLENKKNYPLYKLLLTKYLFDLKELEELRNKDHCKAEDIYMMIFKDVLDGDNFLYLNKQEYMEIIYLLKDVIEKYENKEKFDQKIYDNLKEIQDCLELNEDVLCDFLRPFFESFIKELKLKKKILICKNCKKYTTYYYSKKYCSTKCKKQVENQKYYIENREKIIKCNKEDMRETREIYKKYNEK
jgi:hypothetical protein